MHQPYTAAIVSVRLPSLQPQPAAHRRRTAASVKTHYLQQTLSKIAARCNAAGPGCPPGYTSARVPAMNALRRKSSVPRRTTGCCVVDYPVATLPFRTQETQPASDSVCAKIVVMSKEYPCT